MNKLLLLLVVGCTPIFAQVDLSTSFLITPAEKPSAVLQNELLPTSWPLGFERCSNSAQQLLLVESKIPVSAKRTTAPIVAAQNPFHYSIAAPQYGQENREALTYRPKLGDVIVSNVLQALSKNYLDGH